MEKFSILTKDEKKYYIYKYIIDETDDKEILLFVKSLCFVDIKCFLIGINAMLLKYGMLEASRRRLDLDYTFKNYNILMNQFKKLVYKLNLKNALEVSILYTYLLWKGYFSINKVNNYDSVNTILIDGLFSYDLFDGVGVCINHSDLLKDLLNNLGYKSCNLLASSNIGIRNGKSLIERNIDFSKSNNFLDRLLETHVFTLVMDGEYTYIYDSTNTTIYNIIRPNLSSLINGCGECKIYPINSYKLNYSKESINTLNIYLSMKNFICPYTEEYYVTLFNKLVEYFNKNISLIEDFYKDSYSSIDCLQSVVSDIKKIRKL